MSYELISVFCPYCQSKADIGLARTGLSDKEFDSVFWEAWSRHLSNKHTIT